MTPLPARLLWPLLAATFLGIGLADAQIQTRSAPLGIVSLQLCSFADSCQAILDEWGAPGRGFAMFSLGIDYLFMLLYGAGFLAVLQATRRRLRPSWQAAATWMGRLVWLAVACDAVENLLLLQLLQAPPALALAAAAGYLAAFKFLLLGLAALWIAVSLLAPRGPRQPP